MSHRYFIQIVTNEETFRRSRRQELLFTLTKYLLSPAETLPIMHAMFDFAPIFNLEWKALFSQGDESLSGHGVLDRDRQAVTAIQGGRNKHNLYLVEPAKFCFPSKQNFDT